MGIHGNWLAPLQAEHDDWGRSFIPLAGLWRGVGTMFDHPRNFDDAVFLIIALTALVVAVRTLPRLRGLRAGDDPGAHLQRRGQ